MRDVAQWARVPIVVTNKAPIRSELARAPVDHCGSEPGFSQLLYEANQFLLRREIYAQEQFGLSVCPVSINDSSD